MTNAHRDCSNRLESRQKDESSFFDDRYDNKERYPGHYAVHPTYPVYQRMLDMIGDLSGKSVLEYGCGEGWITRNLARKRAIVSAFDISIEAMRKTSEVLAAAGVADQCKILQMGAEKLDYPDETFDVAVGFAIMHHLDLNLAIPELYRVLKPGGVAYFAEPLGSNPLINMYRWLTPQYRTKDEEPLKLKMLAPLLSRFLKFDHKEYYVTALLSVAISYIPFGKKLFPALNRQLMTFDEALLSWFPGLGYFAWYTIIRLKK